MSRSWGLRNAAAGTCPRPPVQLRLARNLAWVARPYEPLADSPTEDFAAPARWGPPVRPDQDLSPAVDSEDKSKRWRFDLASAKPVERTPCAVHRPSTIGNPRPKPGNPPTLGRFPAFQPSRTLLSGKAIERRMRPLESRCPLFDLDLRTRFFH